MADLGGLVKDAMNAVSGGLFPSGAVDNEVSFQHTRVIASFHTDDGFDGAVDSVPNRTDQPFRIVGLQTNKLFGSAPGSWTLTVKARSDNEEAQRNGNDLMRLWDDPEDVWVRIVVVRNGIVSEAVFGLVNTITEQTVRSEGGARSVVYSIQGEDFHKVFARTSLYINIYENAGQLPIIPLYTAVAKNLIGRPDEVVRTVVNAWLGNNGVADKQWKLPKSLGGRYFFDTLVLDLQKTRGRIFDPALYSPDQMMGRNLWQTLEEYSNGMLNELYTTTGPDEPRGPLSRWSAKKLPKPTLVLRERPFPSKDQGNRKWDDLPTHTLSPGDISGRQVSKGAPESRFNYWLLDAKGLVGDGLATQMQIQQAAGREKGAPGSAPIYNIEDIRRHGFRRFMQSTRFFPFRDDANFLTHAARWLHMLFDWHAVAPYELTGIIPCSKIFPDIKIGHRINERRKDGAQVTYYVEGVSHSWTYPGPGSTTCTVTRGEHSDRLLLDLVYDRVSQSALDSMLGAAVGAVADTLSGAVPHGSGTKLDKTVGQINTPERLFLAQRGLLQDDRTRIRRGELDHQPEDRVSRLRPADLPDQQVGSELEAAVGDALARRERTQGGNLTQDELERGIRAPLPEQTAADESSKDTTDQAKGRWRARLFRGGSRRR